MAVSKDPTLSLVIVVVIPVLFIAIFVLTRKGMPLFKAMQQKLDKLNLVSRENLIGIRVIRAFNRNDYEKKRFYEANFLQGQRRPLSGKTINISIICILYLFEYVGS
ncbi:MAG: hypothetical protein APF76_18115 [Desulfitibacter sp. BRH_c19]|nr:MAG: hypothetical protein APF76_18115 [Desulfitibacter sp. BRH_c19]